MGGDHGGFHALKKNVHIDRYAKMRDQVMTTFKFTPRTARNTFLILGLVPFGFLYIGVVDSNKWDLAGKRRNESLYKYPRAEEAWTTFLSLLRPDNQSSSLSLHLYEFE